MSDLLAILLRFGQRSSLALAIFAGILSGLCGTAILALINRLMNLDDPRRGPHWLLWGFLGFCLLIPLMRVVSTYLFTDLSARAALNLRLDLSGKILAAPLRRLEEVGAQALLMALHRDIGILSDTVTSIPGLAINAAVITGCLVYLGWLSRPLLLIVVCLLALGTASYQLPIKLARRREGRVYQEHRRLYKHFEGLTSGIKELKMHATRQANFLAGLRSTAEGLRKAHLRARLALVSVNSWASVLSYLSIGLLLFLSPALSIHAGREARTGFALVLLFMSGPIEALLNLVPDLARASVAAREIGKLGISLAQRGPEPLPAAPPGAPSIPLSWELAGVTHTYRREHEDDNFLLGPINLRIEPGEITFIAGGNGSGKTTLAKLMAGLYAPESGEIRWNGETVTDESRERYRQSFSVVFSDFFLFSSLLGIADGPESAARAQELLAELELEKKVRLEAGALSTTELSQGQRKRLALLTAFLEARPVYMFDEWAADQDPHFKEIFYRHILPGLRAQGRTVIVISHDDRYYGTGDRVVKLENGSIASDLRRAPVAELAAGAVGT
jgi:putative ATP-binding cassette transporter